jgi:hypothetical protein
MSKTLSVSARVFVPVISPAALSPVTDFHGLSQDHQGPFIAHLRDIESEEGGGGLGDAKDVSWCENDILLPALPRDHGGIVAFG